VRLELMVALDRENAPAAAEPNPDIQRHLAACSSCTEWLKALESMNSRFEAVSYRAPRLNLWATIESRIRQPQSGLRAMTWLWLTGAVVLGWRALQLLVDLPLPMLHPVVPLALAIVGLWRIGADPLAIQTFAPELQKRGL
jgi:hypothetical protein